VGAAFQPRWSILKDWTEKVYKLDILNSAHTLYKQPG